VIARLMLVGAVEAGQGGGSYHPATFQALTRLGATAQQQQTVMQAIVDAAEHSAWRPGGRRTPMGPLMQQAVKAYEEWDAARPKEPDPPNTVRIGNTLIHIVHESPPKPERDGREFSIDIGGDEATYFIDNVEVDEDTYTSQAPAVDGFVIDLDVGEEEDVPCLVAPSPPALSDDGGSDSPLEIKPRPRHKSRSRQLPKRRQIVEQS